MPEKPYPAYSTMEELILIGTMAIYESQAELSEHVADQWRQFRLRHPEAGSNAEFFGASPCTRDHKIHYLTALARKSAEGSIQDESLVLEAGEYAVVRVENTDLLRDTWTWLLTSWLPESGRREKSAPEFERYTGISEVGVPIGPVEIWIPLEPRARSTAGDEQPT